MYHKGLAQSGNHKHLPATSARFIIYISWTPEKFHIPVCTKMLLRFTTADLLNTTLIDVASSDRAYSIATVEEGVEIWSDAQLKQSSSSSSSWSSGDFSTTPRKCRRTTITDSSGYLIASLIWNGRHPDITVGKEHIGGLTNLFGSSTVRFM
jgi:hypothetical protein